ncbi:MAG: DUF1566 domain-containing protein [Bacteroidales bacterium]|nr:DUF1566 domain-containing protein [Bacteroidales bacterium]
MKRASILLLFFLSIVSCLLAQVPEKMSYQAVVRDESGELIKNQLIGVLVSITQGSFLPTVIYSESHHVTTNENGLLTLEIGGGNVISGTFSGIKWENGNVNISTSYDLSGGTSYSLLSSSKLLSVPYALYAKSAGNASGNTGTCPDGTTVGEMKYWDGTQWNTIAPSLDGKVLMLENGVPVWKDNYLTNQPAEVIKPKIDVISSNSILCNSLVISGGGTIIEKGFCYSESPNPTVADYTLVCKDGTGSFSGTLTKGISSGKTYYIKTYVVNNAGISYSQEIEVRIYTVGDYAFGGVIFYLFQPNDPGYVEGEQHGLVCAKEDQEDGIKWNNGSSISTGATGTEIGTGQTNTAAIVRVQGEGSYAAKVCDNYSFSGYSDWFLPSKDELNQMYVQKNIIEATLLANGGHAFVTYAPIYWSSSEKSDRDAWTQSFSSGSQASGSPYKTSSWNVRAVRAF